MSEINKKQIEIKEKTGTRYQSKKLLIDCESQYEYLYNIGFSKNESNIYKLMRWLEENNQINNHTIEANSKIYIPEDREDYIKIISKDAPLAKGAKYTREEFEIKYDDTVIFQHKYRPGKKRNDKNQTSEDMTYADQNSEEIVKNNPSLYTFFSELNHFKSLRESRAQELLHNGISPNTSVEFQEIENRIDSLNNSIIKDAKEAMEWLINFCTKDDSDWETLAFKLYNRFCKNDNTDYKNDIQMPNDISVSTIRSTYSSYIKSVLPKETTTLYDLVEEQNIDISKLGQDIEIDIKKSMSKIEENLDSIDSYIAGCNEKKWKKIMDSLTKEVEEEAETKPKTTAFKCQMIKEFSQIAIYVCNINRKLCASFINTLYHALK